MLRVKAGVVCLQCENCVIHIWALQRWVSYYGALYKWLTFFEEPKSEVRTLMHVGQAAWPWTSWSRVGDLMPACTTVLCSLVEVRQCVLYVMCALRPVCWQASCHVVLSIAKTSSWSKEIWPARPWMWILSSLVLRWLYHLRPTTKSVSFIVQERSSADITRARIVFRWSEKRFFWTLKTALQCRLIFDALLHRQPMELV